MKSRTHEKILFCTSLLFVACGVDEGKKYTEGKLFVGGIRQDQEQSADANPHDAPSSREFQRGAQSEGNDDEGDIDPSTVVLNNRYRAKFDVPSALKLVDGKTPENSFGLARSTIESRLNGISEKDGLLVSQNYGDGVSRSSGQQFIINTPGDAELPAGVPSNSGVQTYDRVTNDATCPSALLCIDRLTFEPTVGASMTFCYYDASGTKRVAIPYAIPPTTKFADLEKVAKTYGPFQARRYRVANMDCNQPSGQPDVIEAFSVEVQPGAKPSASTQSFFHTAGKFNYDYEARMINRRIENDNKSPYIDETIKMQMQTRFVFDDKKSTLAKMIKTVRSSVKLPFPVNLIMSMDGLQVDLHFELCEDLLNENNGNFCN